MVSVGGPWDVERRGELERGLKSSMLSFYQELRVSVTAFAR